MGVNELEQLRKEREHQEDLQRLRGLRPMDDDFMRCLFKDDIKFTQRILRTLINNEELSIISVDTQADMKRLAGARSLCLDAYATDTNGKKYDIEIQRADKGATPKRARYHSSSMDVENLKAGQDFSELPETYIIFITERDIYGEGKPYYSIERVNISINKLFEDGEHILFVNGAFEGDDAIGMLMHDFRCSNPDEMVNEYIANRTRYFKETEKGVEQVCKVMEEMRTNVKIENYVSCVTNLMGNLKLTIEQAVLALGVPDEYKELVIAKISR